MHNGYAWKKFCFNTLNCVSAFVGHYRRPKYRGYTFIAHNSSGFDSYILLEYFVKQGIAPGVTMRGSRVVLMYDKSYDQRWMDSFSSLPMRLAKTPSALGFEDLEKGFFPHTFNTRADEFYVGPYPAPSFYRYEKMSEFEKEKLMAWYKPACEKPFDLQAEMRKYCINDVEVLRMACKIYRETLMECTQIDPFSHATLASYCMGIFKTLFLPKDTLALTHHGAYVDQNKTFSDVSLEWLQYETKHCYQACSQRRRTKSRTLFCGWI